MFDSGSRQARSSATSEERNWPATPGGGHVQPWFLTTSGEARSFDLTQYWRLLNKHKFLIGGVFIASLVAGVVVSLLMTPIYSSSTTLQIDREAARVVSEDADVSPRESLVQGEEFFQTQYGLLRSRSLSERVADSLGLTNTGDFLQTMGVSEPSGRGANATALRRDLVLRTIEENLGVSPVRGSRLVTVGFKSPDPALSARVANSFAENFIASNLDRRFESSSYAREFLEERIAQTKERLEAAERELVGYATAQGIINVSDDGSTSSDGSQSLAAADLVGLNSALSRARAERVAAEEKWRQASSSSIMSLPETLSNLAIQRMLEERARISSEYQQKLSQYRPEYPEMIQLRAQLDENDQQIVSLANDIRSSVRQQYLVAVNEERSLQSRVNALKSDVLDLRDRSVQYNILQREVDTSRTLYDGLLQRYKEVGVAGGVTSNNISVVDRANIPLRPSEPKLALNLALAGLLGLGLGALVAFAVEILDESVGTPEDVEVKLNLPVLGVIPLLPKSTSPLEALGDVRSGMSEAYYSLRTALQFSTEDGAPDVLLITSSRPGEGKSTTAMAVALNFARVGQRVLLIDADLRKPSMHRLMNVDNDVGLSNVLSGGALLAEVARPLAEPNLTFVPCGPLPPNPAELLGGARVQQVLNEAVRQYDIVVIDGPPVLGFADAPVLAAHATGALFVLQAGGTRRGQARGALRRLSVGNSRLLGIVLTKFAAQKTTYGGYDYAYDYNYGNEDQQSRKVA